MRGAHPIGVRRGADAGRSQRRGKRGCWIRRRGRQTTTAADRGCARLPSRRPWTAVGRRQRRARLDGGAPALARAHRARRAEPDAPTGRPGHPRGHVPVDPRLGRRGGAAGSPRAPHSPLRPPGALVSDRMLQRLLAAERDMVVRIQRMFITYDLLLAPVMAEPAVPAGSMEGRGATAPTSGRAAGSRSRSCGTSLGSPPRPFRPGSAATAYPSRSRSSDGRTTSVPSCRSRPSSKRSVPGATLARRRLTVRAVGRLRFGVP